MIDISKPFSLFALCSIEYDGRAYSTLAEGRYLIIYKADGSIIIHGADLCKPRNYQGAGSKLEIEGSTIISTNKKERILIKISEIVGYTPLIGWSDAKIEISRTEKELVDKIISKWSEYFDDIFCLIQKEFKTDHGPIDILGITESGIYYVIEVKRKKGTINNGTQLKRYVDVLRDDGHEVKGFLACPDIGDNALAYLERHGFEWLEVTFDHSSSEES